MAAVLVAAFVVAHRYSESLTNFVDARPIAGSLLYLALNVIDAVVAPGATLPLIPVAAHAWGRIPAALITTAGWTLGSLIAFLIARHWGYPLVKKITSLERVKRLKQYIPENLFWSVVLLRMVMPMDVISYALGLFTAMPWRDYVLATALGVAPSAFVLAFLGKLPHGYEFIMIGIGAAAVVWFIFSSRRRSRGVGIPGFVKSHATRR